MTALLRLLVSSSVALLLTACRPDPEDLFFIIGEVTDPAAGAPVAGQRVLLERSKDQFCQISIQRQSPYALSAEEGGAPVFSTLAEMTTDTEGRYLLEVMRFQVSGTDGRPYCLRTRLPDVPNGGTGEVRFYAGFNDLEPPALYRWTPSLSPTLGSGGLTIAQPALPLPPTEPVDWGQQVEPDFTMRAYEWEIVSADGQPVWREEAKGDLVLPTVALEDFTGAEVSFQLMAITTLYSGSFPLQSSDSFFGLQRSVSSPLGAGPGAPPSRGAPCASNLGPLTPCPLTDGSLAMHPFVAQVEGPEDPPQVLNELRLTLDADRTLRTAVVRDLFYGGPGTPAVIIEGSVDGASWTELGRASQPVGGDDRLYPVYPQLAGPGWYQAIPLNPDAGAFGQVRLRVDADAVIYGIRELSLLE
ncbi:MAG: hypothetical protein M3Y59_18010 [Myxococcota bacterium]|nr:hypothetical protein [Myxococcota bacterium]